MPTAEACLCGNALPTIAAARCKKCGAPMCDQCAKKTQLVDDRQARGLGPECNRSLLPADESAGMADARSDNPGQPR